VGYRDQVTTLPAANTWAGTLMRVLSYFFVRHPVILQKDTLSALTCWRRSSDICTFWGGGFLPSGEWQFHTDVSGQPMVQGTVRALKPRKICCPETSVWNYSSLLRKIVEERRSHLNRDRNLKSLACPSESLVPNYSDTSANEDNSFRNHIR